MKKRLSDGWHKVSGFNVYVEDGYIIRGTLGKDTTYRTAYPYRSCKEGWSREYKITPDAFRAGVKRGTVTMK